MKKIHRKPEEVHKKKTVAIATFLITVAVCIIFVSHFSTPTSIKKSTKNAKNQPKELIASGNVQDSAITNFSTTPPQIPTQEKTETTAQPTQERQRESENALQHVIKNGTLSMTVDSIDDATEKISFEANLFQGSVLDKNIYTADGEQRNAHITIRIPVDQFEFALKKIKEIASVVHYESTTTQNVTEKYTNLETQIENQLEHEKRLRSFFEEAESVDDLIVIEKELARVRIQIETLQTMLNALEKQTTYSSITVDMHEETIKGSSHSWRPLAVAKNALNELTLRFQEIADKTIYFVISGIPILIAVIIGLIITYCLSRKLWHIISKKIPPKI